MKIQVCGAARWVTGSTHLITLSDGYKILLDCGLFQGQGKEIWEMNNNWYFDPSDIDCVILSHAHIDHTGRIPQLVKDGFSGNIHCTHATRSLSAIMLLDSAKIQERDVEWHNRKIIKKSKKPKNLRRPLYVSKDVPLALNKFIGYNYDRWFTIREGVQIMFADAGHILGSASITLRIIDNGQERMIGFTGDIGRPDRPILRDPVQMPNAIEYLICESTYGDKEHEEGPEQMDKFLNIIYKACIEKKGKLIIPAFSIGRTQEIVFMLDKLESSGKLPKIPVYVDSPLAVNATMIFGQHSECYDNDLHEYMLIDDNPFGFNDLTYIRDVADSKELNNSDEACIIISSAGMMNAGRVKHHLFNNIENEKNTFLIVGYCAPYTPGGMLRDGVERITIFGKELNVNASIEIMDSFSAHADRKEIYEFIKNQKNLRSLYLVHGEIERQSKLKEYLFDKGMKCEIEIPTAGQEFKLYE